MDIEAIRRDFPITNEFINLDNAGLSPLPLPVVRSIEQMLHERAQHGVVAFWDWVDLTNQTKELIAALIHADADEIALTQNTSEGINIVANMLDWEPGDNVVLNNLEFFPNYWPWLRLKKRGVEIRMIEHHDGQITTDDWAEQIDDNTKVVATSSVAWANGLRHDLSDLGRIANQHGAYLVVDAIQSVGVLETDVRQGPVDFLACGGHKWLFSLLGSGFFYCRRELIEEFEPAYIGWQSDEDRFDYSFREYTLAHTAQRFMHGNTNIAGVHGLHAGISYINQIGLENIERRNRDLTDYLIDRLSPLGVRFLSPMEEKHRSSFFNFVPSDPEAVHQAAKQRKILLSVREGGIRVSPNFYNTEQEVDLLVKVVKELQH